MTHATADAMAADVRLRPLRSEDVPAAAALKAAASAAKDASDGSPQPAQGPAAATVARTETMIANLIETDAPGCWAAVEGERLVGFAASVRRAHLWGLSLLFVHPDRWSAGVGRRLLTRALDSADGATHRMIQASNAPGAMRRYARA